MGGLAYRILEAFLGILVTALSVTGVVIWLKKRSARLLAGRRIPRPAEGQRLAAARR